MRDRDKEHMGRERRLWGVRNGKIGGRVLSWITFIINLDYTHLKFMLVNV